MSNPWDSRNGPVEGDESLSNLLTSVGFALTVWEHLEFILGQLYQAITLGRHRSSFEAFSSIDSSAVRLRMVEVSAIQSLQDETDLLPKVKALTKRIRKFSPRRNEIAHGMAINMGEKPYGGFQLTPNPIRINKWNDRAAAYQYNSIWIIYYGLEFYDLYLNACEITDEIYLHLSPETPKVQRLLHLPEPLLKSFTEAVAALTGRSGNSDDRPMTTPASGVAPDA